jgi:hypothetical protein
MAFFTAAAEGRADAKNTGKMREIREFRRTVT